MISLAITLAASAWTATAQAKSGSSHASNKSVTQKAAAKSSPTLHQATSTGKHFKKATIELW
jgi:type VI protein secretion system component Hcp